MRVRGCRSVPPEDGHASNMVTLTYAVIDAIEAVVADTNAEAVHAQAILEHGVTSTDLWGGGKRVREIGGGGDEGMRG